MKICPKCNSFYTDETLNFCLTDGIPLVPRDISAEKGLAEFNWQEAVTIYDEELKIYPAAPHVTSPNSAPQTTPKIRLNTASLATSKPPQTRPYLIPLLGVLAMVSVAGGIFWWLFNHNDSTADMTNKQVLIESQNSKKTRTIVSLTPDQENLVKREVTELLDGWLKSIEKRDADANVKFYTNTLETYYKESGIDRNHVRADRQRAIDRYESLALQLDNLRVTPESTESATATFDKTWNFKNPVKVSTGSVQQEMTFIKQNGKWLIDGEKDVKVYYINNRESSAANQSANSGQNSNPNQ